MTQTAEAPNYYAMSKSDLVEIIETQKQVIQAQQTGLDWFGNSDLPIAARFAGYAIHRFIQERKPGEDGYYKGYLPAMAQISGVSASTLSRGIETLAGATEALEKYTRHEYDEDGNKKSLLYFRTHDEFKTPAAIAPTKELAQHGGDHRIICQACGSDDIVEKKRHTCRNCGTVVKDFPERLVNDPLQDATLPIDIPIASCNGSFPNTPPAVEPILDPQETEWQAAQLLVAIAGEHAQHIEMSRTSESSKYFTVHTPLTDKELLAHLRGATTKGVYNRSLDGMTRAICFDGDTPEAWQGLQDAAQLLAAADDFKPVLEPSPAPGEHAGGGHLWIIYSDLVDAYSALYTLYQYVPALRQYKEHWPGGGINMRLPGGKYVRPGFEAECHLFDENMQNGIGTAAMLIERQTPASVVREYTRPAPEPPRQGQGGYLEDLARQYIADFNAARDWSDIAALAGGFVHGKFPAIWRGERVPSVGIWRKTDLAKDFGAPGEPAMDKFDVWCHIEAHYRGMDWQEFKRRELVERCDYRRRCSHDD